MYFFIKDKANEKENAIVPYSRTQLTGPVLSQGGDLNLHLPVTTVISIRLQIHNKLNKSRFLCKDKYFAKIIFFKQLFNKQNAPSKTKLK